MKVDNFLKTIDFSRFRVAARLRAASEFLSPVLVILIHIYACLTLPFYGERPIGTLLVVQYVCLLILLVLQLPTLNRPWIWAVLLANAVFVPISAARNEMSGFATIYAVLLLALLLFRQIVLPRGAYLTIHLFTAVFLTWFLGVAGRMQGDVYYLVLGHQLNSNMIGILGLACMMHWMCFFEQLHVKWGYRLLGQGLGLILGVTYILQSGCRSALVALVLFLLLLLIGRKPFSPRVHQIIALLILAAMAVFPLIYIRLPGQMENLKIFGKTLFSGRETLWAEILVWIRAHPIFGNGISFNFSAHHILLELLLCLGIVPFVSFLLLCGRKEVRAGQSQTCKVAQMAFLACMLIAFFESFFTNRYLNMLFLSFLLSAVEQETSGATH